MAPSAASIFLVIPCFEESSRLPPFLRELCQTLTDLSKEVSILIVDDGSSEPERIAVEEEVQSLRESHGDLLLPLLPNHHLGKGGTILAGWKEAPADTRYFAFVDADGAIPPGEVRRVFETLLAIPTDECPRTAFFGIRQPTDSTEVQRHPLRLITGRVYAWLVNFLLQTRIYDSACGFKIFPNSFIKAHAADLTEMEWALDIEIIARLEAHGFPIREIPIDWEEKGGSKIALKDFLKIIGALVRIKWKSRHW